MSLNGNILKLDFDNLKFYVIRLKVLNAYYLLKENSEHIKLSRSRSGEGIHIVARLKESADLMKLRAFLGDDINRQFHDYSRHQLNALSTMMFTDLEQEEQDIYKLIWVCVNGV